MELVENFEISPCALQVRRSASELHQQFVTYPFLPKNLTASTRIIAPQRGQRTALPLE